MPTPRRPRLNQSPYRSPTASWSIRSGIGESADKRQSSDERETSADPAGMLGPRPAGSNDGRRRGEGDDSDEGREQRTRPERGHHHQSTSEHRCHDDSHGSCGLQGHRQISDADGQVRLNVRKGVREVNGNAKKYPGNDENRQTARRSSAGQYNPGWKQWKRHRKRNKAQQRRLEPDVVPPTGRHSHG